MVEFEEDIGSTDILDWKIALKKRNKRIKEIMAEFGEYKQEKAKDISKIMQDKIQLTLEIADLKKSLEFKENELQKFKEQKFTEGEFQRLREVKEETGQKLIKASEERDNQEKKIRDLERKIREKDNDLRRSRDMLSDKTDEIEDTLITLQRKTSEFELAKKRIKELEDKYMGALHDEKGRKIGDLLSLLDEKDLELHEFKSLIIEKDRQIDEVSIRKEKGLDVESKIEAEGERVSKQFEEKMARMQREIETLQDFIKSQQMDLKKITGSIPEFVAHGEAACLSHVKRIFGNTKRNALIFLPKFDPHVKQLDLSSAPSKISIRVATSWLKKDESLLAEFDDRGHIEVRHFHDANIMAIITDAENMFISFLDEKGVPMGFQSSNSLVLEFLGSMLRSTYGRLKKFF